MWKHGSRASLLFDIHRRKPMTVGVDLTSGIDSRLAARYTEILQTLSPDYLDRKHEGLSHPFLSSGPSDPRARKIMVIGRECGGKSGWTVKDYKGEGPQAYVTAALAQHRRALEWGLNSKHAKKPGRFLHFLKRVHDLSPGGVIYSNLFAFDVKGKDPRRLPEHYPKVRDFSKLLLQAQIDHFQPDVIVFANGIDSADVRREFFPLGKGMASESVRHWEPAIPKGQLWQFQLYGKYPCFRIQHPSAWSKPAYAARKYLLTTVLPEALARAVPESKVALQVAQ